MPDIKEPKEDPLTSNTKEVAAGEITGEIRDIGAELYAEVDQLTPEELEREGAEVRKLLDWRILPIVSVLRGYSPQGLY